MRFSYQRQSNSKSPLVSRTFLSILADLTNSIVWIVSILSLISNSFRLFFNFFFGGGRLNQLQLLSPSCSTVFLVGGLVHRLDRTEQKNPLDDKFFFSSELTLGFVF